MVDINYLAVIVSTIILIVLGFIWYGPFFGKTWTKELHFTEEDMKRAREKGMMGSYIIQIIGAILMSWVLALFITSGEAHYGIWTASYGAHIALYLWFGLVLPITISSVLWERKSWKAWFINIGYYLVGFIIIGAMFGAWH